MVFGPLDENAAMKGAGFVPNSVVTPVMQAFGDLSKM